MTSNTLDFAQRLAEERALIEQFVELLKVEQLALSGGRVDELPAYAEKKALIIAGLNTLTEQRGTDLDSLALSKDKAGVAGWCKLHPEQEEAARHWASILSLAAEARELNRLNGELIQIRMQYNARALESLQGGKAALDLYGPDGQSASRSQQRINDSV